MKIRPVIEDLHFSGRLTPEIAWIYFYYIASTEHVDLAEILLQYERFDERSDVYWNFALQDRDLFIAAADMACLFTVCGVLTQSGVSVRFSHQDPDIFKIRLASLKDPDLKGVRHIFWSEIGMDNVILSRHHTHKFLELLSALETDSERGDGTFFGYPSYEMYVQIVKRRTAFFENECKVGGPCGDHLALEECRLAEHLLAVRGFDKDNCPSLFDLILHHQRMRVVKEDVSNLRLRIEEAKITKEWRSILQKN